ncbi:hypothetical protein LTS12_002193 [Elasticomyces elasticus]|nr:hypothetical protein LTS12_002193 [Elasticomyces elasticus]
MAHDTDPIANRCKRYKAGTNKLIRWLYIKTAASAGQSVTTTPSTQDLLRQAETIVTATPKIEIPLEMIVIAEDVIEGRQVCAEWYSANEDGADEEVQRQNSSHRNFIAVLRQILDKLQQAYDERANRGKKVKSAVTAASKAEVLRNIYDYLDIEQPSATPLGGATTGCNKSAKSASQPSQMPDIHVRDLEEADKAFAVYCLFKDQYDVAQYLKVAWDDHVAGKIAFCTVCELTNAGSLLMREASNTFVAEYPTLAGMFDITEFLGFSVATLAEGLTTLTFCSKKFNSASHSDPALHELFCIRAYRVLADYTTHLQDSSSAYYDGPDHRFAAALQAMVPEILLLYHARTEKNWTKAEDVPRPLSLDIFLSALMEIAWVGRIAPWLVMACDVYMHIYDVLGLHVAEGYDILHNDACRLRRNHAEVYNFADVFKTLTPCPPDVTQHFRDNIAKYIDTDVVAQLHAKNGRSNLVTEIPSFHIQKLMPVACGHMMYTQQQSLHVAGLRMCNAGFAIVTAAHLYTAAQHCGFLQGQWLDMDWLMAHQGAKKPVVLESKSSATPLESLAKHYRITLGGKLPKKNEKTFGGANSWTWSHATGPPHKIHYAELPTVQRTLQDGRKIDVSSSSPYLQHIATRANKEAMMDGRATSRDVQHQALQHVASMTLDRQAASAQDKRKTRSGKLPAVQVLEAFADMLREDELNFNFNYTAFSRTCYDFLVLLHRMYTPMGDGNALSIPPVANTILWELAMTEKGLAPEHTILFQTRHILQQTIDDRGAQCTEDAKTRCSSHMQPPLQVPCTEVPELDIEDLLPLHDEGLEKLHELYALRGIAFDSDLATRTVMFHSSSWKTNTDAHIDVLRSFGANMADINAVVYDSADAVLLDWTGTEPQEANEEVKAWKLALYGTESPWQTESDEDGDGEADGESDEHYSDARDEESVHV